MANRNASRPDRWPLRRGDLPSRRVRAREPRLAELENNPVFRSLCFDLHGARGWFLPARTLLIFLSLAALVVLFPLSYLLITLGLTLWLTLRSPIRYVTDFLGVRPWMLRELMWTRPPAREWVDAYWGYHASARRTVLVLLSLVLLFALAVVLVHFAEIVDEPWEYTALLTLLFAYLASGRLFLPAFALPGAAMRLEWLARRNDFFHNEDYNWLSRPLSLGVFLAISWGLLSCLGGWAVFIGLMLVNAFVPPDLTATSPPALVAIVLLIGLVLAALRAKWIALHREAYLDRMHDAMQDIHNGIRRQWRLEGENGPATPRKGPAPASATTPAWWPWRRP